MMEHYYVGTDAQRTGEHEVHKSGCLYLPYANNRKYLGMFMDCEEALARARDYYDNVDGCKWCAPECHRKILGRK